MDLRGKNISTKTARVALLLLLAISVISTQLLGGAFSVLAASGVPRVINHQGRLLDASGNLLGGAGTDFCFKFSLFSDAAVGGPDTQLWPAGTPATMTATVVNGVYNVGVGDTAAGGDTLNFDFQTTDEAYLNIQVASKVGTTCASGDGAEVFETLSPRQRVGASGYALNSASVGGFSAAQSATGNQIPVLTSGNLVLGGTDPQIKATGSNTLSLQAGVTGDIEFFSGLNVLTSSGDLSLAGDVAVAGTLQVGSGNVTITTSAGAVDADALGLISGDGTGATSSGSGLETDTDRLGLLQGCSNNQILKWNDGASAWQCATDVTGGGGGSLAVRESDGTPDVDPTTTLEFGPATTSSNEFVLTDEGGGVTRVRIGTQVARLDEDETVSGNWTFTNSITANGGLALVGNFNLGTNSIVTGGATISSTELDRLDGKDAALVDTNDAVSTAITGTGALNSGSITSGFGAINVGNDTITTTGTIGTAGSTAFTGNSGTFSGAIAANGGITFDNSTDTLGAHTLAGTVDANGNLLVNIGNAGTDFTADGGLVLADDLEIAGGDLVASTGSFNLLNQTTTTINFGGAATTVSIGAGTGTTTVNNALTSTGTLTASGSFVANGDTTLGNAAADGVTVVGEIRGANPLTFEGATNDNNRTTFAITDPSANRTITFRDASGTVAFLADVLSPALADNVADAYDLEEGTNNYINIETTDGAEAITLGNATTNPTLTFAGTGLTTLGGGLTVGGAITLGSNNIVTGAATISSAELDRLDGKDTQLVDANDDERDAE